MSKVFVKPVGRIRQPDRGNRVMPEEGRIVDLNNPFYQRLKDTGNIVEDESQNHDAPKGED